MMKTHISRISFLLIPLVVLNWHTTAFAVVASEAEASVSQKSEGLKTEAYIARAEAAKQFAAALEMPVPVAEPHYRDVGFSHWPKNYIAAAAKSGCSVVMEMVHSSRSKH